MRGSKGIRVKIRSLAFILKWLLFELIKNYEFYDFVYYSYFCCKLLKFVVMKLGWLTIKGAFYGKS